MKLSKKHWLGFGCLGAVVVLCIAGGALVWVANRAVGAVQGASAACQGRPVEGAAPYRPGQAQRVVGFQHSESGGWSYAGILPHSFPDAESVSEATLVFCLEPGEDREVESCSYQNGVVVRRMGRFRPVRVVAAATGETVREVDVEGAPAPACPEQVSLGGGGGGVSVRVVGIPVATVGEEAELPTERVQQGGEVNRLAIEAAFGDLVL